MPERLDRVATRFLTWRYLLALALVAALALIAPLCAVLLGALTLEMLLVFHPAVRWLRLALAEREREALDRELVAAAAAARRIGYDLHDGVGQTLTALTLQAKTLEVAVPPEYAPRVAALREGLRDALAQTRVVAAGLAPVDLRVEGLIGALARLASSTSVVAGVDCRVESVPGLRPPPSEDLYRIAQEAVANAMRHGGARAILIALGDELLLGLPVGVLRVRDDGRGGAAGVEGVGMRSMRHRAARLGGVLSAGPLPEGGWLVECRFPLTQPALAAAS